MSNLLQQCEKSEFEITKLSKIENTKSNLSRSPGTNFNFIPIKIYSNLELKFHKIIKPANYNLNYELVNKTYKSNAMSNLPIDFLILFIIPIPFICLTLRLENFVSRSELIILLY